MILLGDCIDAMRDMDEASVDAIVTDPPYGLEFMGKEWDRLWREAKASDNRGGQGTQIRRGSMPDSYRAGLAAQQWHQAWATEALRVLRPGGHLLAFGGTRTYHRLACAIEDAGFEIRDSVIWLYGSGFPKSLDVSKAIDKAAGVEREVVGVKHADRYPNGPGGVGFHGGPGEYSQVGRPPEPETAPATPEAQQWQGWGTALKPAHEPIVVARKPLIGTVAQNVQTHGTGAINVDGCRIGMDEADRELVDKRSGAGRDETADIYAPGLGRDEGERFTSAPAGRWPPNVALSHIPPDENGNGGCERVGTRRVKTQGLSRPAPEFGSDSGLVYGYQTGSGRSEEYYPLPVKDEQVEAWRCAEGCPVAELDRQSGDVKGAVSNGRKATSGDGAAGIYPGASEQVPTYGDTGGASRFFYTAKSSRAERVAGVGVNAHPT